MKYPTIAIVSLALAILLNDPLHAAEVNQTAPSCHLAEFTTPEKTNSQDFKNKVYYVDFWASWCPPCLRSFPFMNKISQQHTDKDLEIIAINLDEDLDDAKQFLDRTRQEFKVVVDAAQQCAKAFDVKVMPSSYLIDRKGVIRHIHLGFKTDETEELSTIIAKLLAEGQPAQ
jgi:thiol-disulfide isomerase/thioredoxin